MRYLVVALEASSQDPVYEQIARQIRSRIVSGELAPGASLPAVRTLASDLGVNLNTVARAYRFLADQGFVRIRDRSGAEVAAPAARPDALAGDRLKSELSEVLARMRQVGLSPDELRTLAEREISALTDRPGKGRTPS